jgi:hypothetical protein
VFGFYASLLNVLPAKIRNLIQGTVKWLAAEKCLFWIMVHIQQKLEFQIVNILGM